MCQSREAGSLRSVTTCTVRLLSRYQGAIDENVQQLRASRVDQGKAAETTSQLKNRRTRDKKRHTKVSRLVEEMYVWINQTGLGIPPLSESQVTPFFSYVDRSLFFKMGSLRVCTHSAFIAATWLNEQVYVIS